LKNTFFTSLFPWKTCGKAVGSAVGKRGLSKNRNSGALELNLMKTYSRKREQQNEVRVTGRHNFMGRTTLLISVIELPTHEHLLHSSALFNREIMFGEGKLREALVLNPSAIAAHQLLSNTTCKSVRN